MAVVVIERRLREEGDTEVWLSKDGVRARVLIDTGVLAGPEGLSVLEIMADHAIATVRESEDRAKIRLGD